MPPRCWPFSFGACAAPGAGGQSVKFYVSGLAYLLLGIIVGTGLWLGWSVPLRIGVPLEVHIHANNWGFLSLVFAGLLVDVIPQVTGRQLASPRTISAIFWAMALGALGLVLGPWLDGSLWFTVPGLVLHISATITVVALTARALTQSGQLRIAGGWHLLTAYLWILLPVFVAPLIILGVPGFPGRRHRSHRPASADLRLGAAIWLRPDPLLCRTLSCGRKRAPIWVAPGSAWPR